PAGYRDHHRPRGPRRAAGRGPPLLAVPSEAHIPAPRRLRGAPSRTPQRRFSMSHTILLVDADESTTAFLADQLAADGYRALVAHALDAIHEVARAAAPHVRG